MFWTRIVPGVACLFTMLALFLLVQGKADPQTPASTAAPVVSNDEAAALKMEGITAEKNNGWDGRRLVSVWHGDPGRKEIALTFDDGPHREATLRLLDLLRGLKVKATFFLVGKKVDETPDVLPLIVRDGHEVANHTYHHINLDKADDAVVQSEIQLGNDAIRRACGVQPTAFRPPGGHHRPNVLRNADKLNMKIILWTNDPADYAMPGQSILADRLDHVSNGTIILLHDGIDQTMEVLPNLIARLRRDGYHFVTVSEMVKHLEASGPVEK